MKFIKLEMQNLASLDRQGGETINFEEGALGDSTIFSIVGPTGSGKSTILDAICLALYNRTPRYPRKKGDRNQNIEIYGELEADEKNRLAPTDSRNILTRGKKEGFSKLTFLANNGIVYRAEWYVRKKTKIIESPTLSLYRISMANGVQSEEHDDWETLPQIIGLDYDQFLRTVLIAQGSFANFLNAKENERYELLEKLIGCEELYTSIAAKIKQQKDEAVKAYDQIAANFKAQEKDIIPEEELTAIATRVEELEKMEKAAKEELLKVTEALAWYAENEKHLANIEKFERAFTEANEQLKSFAEQANRLSLHDATLPAVALFKDIKNSESNIAKHEKTLEDLRKDISEKEQQIKSEEEVNLKQLKLSAQNAADEYEKQKPHINKAREIKIELDALKTSLTEKAKAKDDADKGKGKADKDVADNEKSIKQAETELGKAKQSQIALQERIKADEKLVKKTADEAVAAYNKEAEKLEGHDATKLQDAKTLAENALSDIKSAIRIQTELKTKRESQQETIRSQHQLADRNRIISEQLTSFKIEELRQELDTLVRTYTLMTSEDWGTHRSNLVEGEACPLCGATHHPYHNEGAVVPVINEMNDLVAKKQKTLNEQLDLKEQLSQEQSKNNGRLDGLQNTLKTLESEITSLTTEWNDIIVFHNDWSDDVETLQSLKQQIEKMVADATDMLKSYNNLLKRVDELRKDKESAEKAQQEFAKTATEKMLFAEKKVTDANTLLEKEKGKTDNLKAQQLEKAATLNTAKDALAKVEQDVALKTQALKQEIGDRDPDAFEKELNNAKTKADEAVSVKTEYISHLRQELTGLKGREDTTKTQKGNEQGVAVSKKEELLVWLSEYNKDKTENLLSEETIAHFYSSTDNWEDIRSTQKNLSESYTSAKTTFENEKNAYLNHQHSRPSVFKVEENTTSPSDSSHSEAEEKEFLIKRKAELESISNQELVDTKARLQRHNTAKEQMGNMFSQKQETEQVKQEWEAIYDAIGSDGKTLRKIAQCYTLRFLIEHANVEIRKFNSRYELLQVKNSLGIRVIDHDRADDVRDTTSLSGGETFIVSLGLALGLSALSSRNISFENLFIDEGFGTLDPDTLDTVIDSLSILQSSQGKKVGVISHTDTMFERIGTQIRIIKNGNSGSSHIEFYP